MSENGRPYTTEELIEEIATRAVPLPDCRQCEFQSYASGTGKPEGPGWEGDHNYARWRRTCSPCKTRTPYTWVRDIDPQDLEEFVRKHPHAFAIEELRPLVKGKIQASTRRGWEFL